MNVTQAIVKLNVMTMELGAGIDPNRGDGFQQLFNVATTLSEEVLRLQKEINTPEVVDFFKAVQTEAAHQRQKWGAEHDEGKSDLDWNWTLGYLVGKALRGFHAAEEYRNLGKGYSGFGEEFLEAMEKQAINSFEKGLHHLITSAALLTNWHSARVGGAGKVMRPGIVAPKEVG